MKQITFIDLFAGCGGISLGLSEAGLIGHFAIEKSQDAFRTLTHNLCNSEKREAFFWPKWLPCQAMTTRDLLTNFSKNLDELKGKIDIIAGGPPCQGFSFAGRRNPDDPRNQLTEEYIHIVSKIQPKILLLENVRGYQVPFIESNIKKKRAYADDVIERIENLPVGYKVFRKIVKASSFGVPQQRPRFILLAIRKDIFQGSFCEMLTNEEFYEKLFEFAADFKRKNGLNQYTPLRDAISDLEITKKKLKNCVGHAGFKQLDYKEPAILSPYLQFIRKGCSKGFQPNSLRLPNHRQTTIEKFTYILQNNPKGTSVIKEIKQTLNMQKQCISVLSKDALAKTMTTLPDDCLHYSEPRILTVREVARIQSFPDWFDFQGKYTTGGLRRRVECPRYTQVGNAVPPLMSQVIGLFIKKILTE